MFVRAGELVSRQCLDPEAYHFTRPPRACRDKLFARGRYVKVCGSDAGCSKKSIQRGRSERKAEAYPCGSLRF